MFSLTNRKTQTGAALALVELVEAAGVAASVVARVRVLAATSAASTPSPRKANSAALRVRPRASSVSEAWFQGRLSGRHRCNVTLGVDSHKGRRRSFVQNRYHKKNNGARVGFRVSMAKVIEVHSVRGLHAYNSQKVCAVLLEFSARAACSFLGQVLRPRRTVYARLWAGSP